MTIQIEEKIIINDEQYILLSKPLDPFLKILDKDLKLVPFGSNCWRGYIGTWTIMNNVLYLTYIKLNVRPQDKEKVIPLLLDDVILQAWWYTGELRVPFGKQYERTSYYYPLHEKEMIFTVEEGVITDHKIIENDEPEYEDNGLPF